LAAKRATWTENRCKRVTIGANASSRTAAGTAAANVEAKAKIKPA
jgi:hypothetical protein